MVSSAMPSSFLTQKRRYNPVFRRPPHNIRADDRGKEKRVLVNNAKQEYKHLSRPFVDLKRMISLSDGVFAIALTLLALELILPPLGSADLAKALEQFSLRV